jgi:hypothetical protein
VTDNLTARIHDAILDFYRRYGTKIVPWYIVLGKTEIHQLATEFQSRPHFGFQGSEYKTPNRFYSAHGEHRIVAVPLHSHFSLGFDPDVANHYDQTTPYWSTPK